MRLAVLLLWCLRLRVREAKLDWKRMRSGALLAACQFTCFCCGRDDSAKPNSQAERILREPRSRRVFALGETLPKV